MRSVALLLLAAWGCAGSNQMTPDRVLWRISDPSGDVRLIHPDAPGITTRTFDLRKLELAVNSDYLFVTATFAEPVRQLKNVRLSEDRWGSFYPQTVDVYVDTRRSSGRVSALEGRGFDMPTSQGWERALVLTSLPDMTDPDVIYPLHLISRGRKLIGIFDRQDIDEPILGALAAVMATTPWGTSRVREVSTFKTTCTDWRQRMCLLFGKGPPVMDATAEVSESTPVALTYINEEPPPPEQVPLVMNRPPVLAAAPVAAGRVKPGHIATVVDKDGQPLATAVVVSVIGDTATLEVLKGAAVDEAAGVTFGETP